MTTGGIEQKTGRKYFQQQAENLLTIELFVQVMDKCGAGPGGRKTFSE